ncbi:unnamed protein product [Prorocentrum cordatum]|uniref:RING-type domain-containing protein n=1 Tax=Prorocentrum cordatum TaxID=2364126 RepID=A0ABN9RJG2_9DINO|nr:unnamed protein product [Polarella glacialis]
MPASLVVVREYLSPPLCLGGPGVHILSACLGAFGQPELTVDCTEQLQEALRQHGHVWLSASACWLPGVQDPAPGWLKRLSVVYEGVNEGCAASATVAFGCSLLCKVAVAAGVLALVGDKAAAVAALASPAVQVAALGGELAVTGVAAALAWMSAEGNPASPFCEKECAVCMQSLHCDDVATITTCQHTFHWRCLEKWGQVSNSCPTCRSDLPRQGQHHDGEFVHACRGLPRHAE